MDVMELDEADEPAWDEYVQHSHAGTPYHPAGWKRVIEESYGHPSHYLVVKEGGRIEGVLPVLSDKAKPYEPT